MKKLICICSLLFSLSLYAQKDSVFVDTKYLEDQFYLGVQYSEIISSNNISNNGIPYSFQVGFIKDLPINKQRDIGFGLGIGYSYDVIRPDITITSVNDVLVYDIDNSWSSYKYSAHNIEIPLEFRWRTSTATKYSFWRVYTGASLIYNLSNLATFDTGSGSSSFSNLEVWNSLNYTIYTSVGFGTWNLHLKYYVNPVFKEGTLTSEGASLDFHPLRLGVMFYIL